MTAHDPNLGRGGTAILLTGPFGDPERVIALDRPMTIAEVIAAHDLNFRLPTIAIMGGDPVMRGEWNVRVVRPQDTLGFVAVPAGGGDGGGKQIIGLVASIALAIAAPMIGGFIAGNVLGLTGAALTIGTNLVAGLVMVGGSMLLNALFPPSRPDPAQAAESVYIASAAGNQATPFEPLLDLYGRERFPPRFAARPYAEFIGNDQYLYQLFHVTLGKAEIERIEIGETIAWTADDGYTDSFSDLEFEIVHPGGEITLFPANVITAPEVANIEVPDSPAVLGPFVANAPGTTVDRLAVDFAFGSGLFTYSNGNIASRSVSLTAQYRAIDDAGAPVGGWTNLFSETITLATRTPQRMSRAASVPAGRYEVRFFSSSAFSTDPNVSDKVHWVSLRGYLTGFVTPPGCTLLAMKVRANEQLSQSSSGQIKVIATRYLDIWDGEEWVESKTRSIAWAAANVLRNSDYALGLQDMQYDLAELARLDDVWAGRGDTFNYVFDRPWTANDALRAILRAGRAQPVRIGGKIGFTRLEPKAIKRAVFTTRNVIRDSFSHELILFDEQKPDSVIGQYRDENVWDTREVRASLAAIGSDAPQKIEYIGITNHDQLWREAVTDAAVNAYQREVVGFTSEWEGKLLVRGDPIVVHHPLIERVDTAALRDRDGDIFTIDRHVPGTPRSTDWDDEGFWFDAEPWEDVSFAVWDDADTWSDDEPWDDEDLWLIIRGRTGTEWGPCRVTSLVGRTLVLDAEDRAIVEAQPGLLDDILPSDVSEAAHLIICKGDVRPFNGLIVSARPHGPDRVDVLAIVDAPEVYLADGTEVMPSPWHPPTLPPAIPTRPVVLGLNAMLRAAGPGAAELDAMWQPAPGATHYVAEVSYDGGDSWVEVYNNEANRFSAPVQAQPLTLRVSAMGTVRGPYAIREFLIGEVPDVRIRPEDFPLDIRPVEVVNVLPAMGNFDGRIVFLTTDKKLYRHTGSPAGALGFTRAVDGEDLVADSVTAGKVAAAAIGTIHLEARSVVAEKIAFNGVETPNIALSAVTHPYSLIGPNSAINLYQTLFELTLPQTIDYTAGVVTGNVTVGYQLTEANSYIAEFSVWRRYGTSGPWAEGLTAWGEILGLGWTARRISFAWADPDTTPGVRQYIIAGAVTLANNPANPVNVGVFAPNLVTLYHQR